MTTTRSTSLRMLLAVLVMAITVSTSQASIIGGFLNFDGQVNLVEDNSVGIVSGDLQQPQIGDVLQGIFKSDHISGQDVSAAGVSIWGIYSLEIAAVSFDGVGRPIAEFAPATGADSITSLMTALGLTTPSTVRHPANLADATLMIVEKTGVELLPDFDGVSLATTLNGMQAGLFGSEWDASMLLGFVAPTDYHEVRLDEVPPTPSDEARYRLANTVIADEFAAGIFYNNVAGGATQFTTGGPYSGEFVSISNTTIDLNDPNPPAAGWDFSDKGNFGIAPVPEPGSFLVWAGLAGVALLLGRGRRR